MEKDKNPILFLHLSDIHIQRETDINDQHIQKMIDSLKSYKSSYIKNAIIVISGDVTNSGHHYEFVTARKLLGAIIKKLNTSFGWRIHVLIVPGNHDVMHGGSMLNVEELKQCNYSNIVDREHQKLKQFYDFAKFNKCFPYAQIYYDIRRITIDGYIIQANLINNAIFSTTDEYKGMLYIPDDQIQELCKDSEADFTITVMHHAPDYYRDDIKNSIEAKVIQRSSILFHGHEHYNYNKRTSYNGSRGTIIQSGGCLCNHGNWKESSYIVGLLDPKTSEYTHQEFAWNEKSGQYEHKAEITEIAAKSLSQFQITEDFHDVLYDDYDKDIFVFPTIMYHRASAPDDDRCFRQFEGFRQELLNHHHSIITGLSGSGKSTLLKRIFDSLSPEYFVLYCSPELIIEKSNKKRQNIPKLIKALFTDMYGGDDSSWQTFEQYDREKCVFICDDFDLISGIQMSDFYEQLGSRFGMIVLSTSQTIDFNLSDMFRNDYDDIARFEIKPYVGNKRRELIESVVKKTVADSSETNVKNIVMRVDQIIKTQLNIIPPEPNFIIKTTKLYMDNIGDAIYSSPDAFNKVFEADITLKISSAIKHKYPNIRVEHMLLLFGRIAHYIHFNKAYPIHRSAIDAIIQDYNNEYGNTLETESILSIAKTSRILINSEGSQERFRFSNKSVLAYFVAKEIIKKYRETNDSSELQDIIHKACFNICTDILMFIIFITDDTSILNNILSFISKVVKQDSNWDEFSIPNNIPNFLQGYTPSRYKSKAPNIKSEKRELERSEEKAEEAMLTDFNIRDIYDWDDSVVDDINNRLIRMTSLLQIISKSLPCFEYNLKREEKQQLIEYIYRLPNMIFMYWASMVDTMYDDLIEELSLHPYFTIKHPKLSSKEIEKKAKDLFSTYSISTLLNLYYASVINATNKNTVRFLNDTEFFDYNSSPTYQLEQLMILEQITDNDEFVKRALKLKNDFNDYISTSILRWIVRHGIITRTDKRENIDKLQDAFYPYGKKPLLLERAKNKDSKK